MVRLLRGEANRYAVSIGTDLATDVPKIMVDRVQLQQVFTNLMLNGIEAMKDTGGVLTVKVGRGENRAVLISISDTGVGLPAEKADQIFDAFFTTKAQGLGDGTGHQPLDCRVSGGSSVGECQLRTRRYVSVHIAYSADFIGYSTMTVIA
jgi:signal transduction histidine kinase